MTLATVSTTVALVATYSCLSAQTYIPGRYKPTSGDMSMKAAVGKANSFLSLVGISPGTATEQKVRFTKRHGFPGRFQWEVTTLTYWVYLDSKSGLITSYVNAKRQDDRYRGKNRTGTRFVGSEQAAKSYLRTVATKLGVPRDSVIANFAIKRDGEGQDSRPMGRFGGVFKTAGGDIIATLSCDLQDGLILVYTRSR